MSKSTIVSLIPFDINEQKPTYPGNFFIPGAKEDDFETLVVGDVLAFKYIDEFRGTDKINIDSADLARAIIDDFVNSQLAIRTGEGIAPGIFFIPGEHSKIEIKTKFKEELLESKKKQTKWFEVLVKMADDDWEKTRQHRVISGIQRYAARYLNLDRIWLIEPKMTKCVACRSTVEAEAVICPTCKAILKPGQYKSLEFAKV